MHHARSRGPTAALVVALVAALVAALAGCDGSPETVAGDAPPTADAGPLDDDCPARARTCAEVLATFTAAGADVEATCDEAAGSFTISASGLPNYPSNQSTPNVIGVQGWVLTLPLRPACAATPESVVASRGPIGLMINGVAFYGPQNAQGQDAPTTEAATLDDCDGHADMMCTYHYHSDPDCVFGAGDTIAAHALADGHPAVVGYALDGFGLFGPYAGDGGADLDACNGHVDATRGYHYHVTASSPYFVGCLRGVKQALQATDRGCE
jgi:hypothetical protein